MAPADEFGEERIETHLSAFSAFAERSPEFARDLIGRLIDKGNELDRRAKRDFMAMLLVAITFELLNRRLLGEASAFGLKAAKLDFLKYFAPIAVAFILLHIIITVRDQIFCRNLTNALCDRAYPELRRSLIVDVVTPSAGLLSSVTPPAAFLSKKSNRRRDIIDASEYAIIVLIIPIVFTVYSISQLFQQSRAPFIGAIFSLSASVLVLTAAGYGLSSTVRSTAHGGNGFHHDV